MSTKHILVVEDEQHLAHGIKFNFEAEGYRVTVVGDGPTALKLVEQDPQGIDLVILDLMLPGMSGYAVCEALRDRGSDVPVLMLTARTLAVDRRQGYSVGADQYLEKPFDLEKLLSEVDNLLHRRNRRLSGGAQAGDVLRFGEAEINFSTFEARVAGQPLRLTPIEMTLLRYFAEHEGRVVDRTELLENVWGHATSPATRTVDNFIVRLRKYFEKDPSRPRHFLSVRGAGYRFLAAGDGEGA